MELKWGGKRGGEEGEHRLNRTFMELKSNDTETRRKSSRFKSHLYGIEIFQQLKNEV